LKLDADERSASALKTHRLQVNLSEVAIGVRRAGTGRNKMRRICFAIGSVAALVGFALAAPVGAAPPTVTPTPGYDARLQEQRAAQAYSAPANAPVLRDSRPLPRHHAKRVHDGAH
jgi:hypothetical protein